MHAYVLTGYTMQGIYNKDTNPFCITSLTQISNPNSFPSENQFLELC